MKLEDILNSVNDTDELLIGPGILEKCGPLFKKHWKGKSAQIVADTNTWKAAGEKLFEHLRNDGIDCLQPIIFDVPPILHADYEYCKQIIEKVRNFPEAALIAVGSGTINDLVKRASFELGDGYLSFGTAASVDGYCSPGAALSKNGLKQTLACPAPRVVMADTDILKIAPIKSSIAGYGDLASKYTAGADWIIADFTGDSTIHKPSWDIVHLNLDSWLVEPERIPSGDPNALYRVFEGLNFCGLAMQRLGNSRSAAGAEHMLSHIWEMSGHVDAEGERVLHGLQVSVGIMCITALVEEILKKEPSDFEIDKIIATYPSWEERTEEIKTLMSPVGSWESCLDKCRTKYFTTEQLEKKLYIIKDGWDELKTKVRSKLPGYDDMKKMLETAGCPVRPEDINLERGTALASYPMAQCIKHRYTCLDFAYDLGILDECVSEIGENRKYLR
jgi:glycerol-1-phosphate dehydrogenase [NAD(P)+]